jgi:cysteine synthase A
MDPRRPEDARRNVFPSIRDFFDPDQHPPTPLVRLPSPLNPFPAEERVELYAKLMFLTPTLNLKWTPAYAMLEEAERTGGLTEAPRLVEASSGNMALALALQCRAFGVAGLTALVPADLAFVKKEMLHLTGVDLSVSKEVPGEPGAVARARSAGDQPGWLNLGQYENPLNPGAHARWTAPQVWEQTGGALTVFCAGLGTSGCLGGAREAYGTLAPQVQMVGCLCAPGSAVPGVRTEARMAEIRFDWRAGIHPVEGETKESYRESLRLIRAGLLAGPSSGFALAGLLRFLQACRQDPARWAGLRNRDGAIVAAFVCGDTPHLYIDKYSTILDAADFAV